MSDGQFLYAAAAGLTLAECLFWLRAGGAAFHRVGRRWATLLPSRLLGNARGGVGVAFPFPLLSRLHLSHPLPVSLSSRGVVNGSLEAVGGEDPALPARLRLLPWEEGRTAAAQGGALLAGGRPFAACGSPAQAELLAEALSGASGAPTREELGAVIALTFDRPGAEEILRLAEEESAPLLWLGSAQFLLLFLILPMLAWKGGSAWLGWGFLAVALLDLALAGFHFRAHRRLFPWRPLERVAQTLGVAIFPPMAVRSADILTRRALGAYHPLLTARLLLPEDRFRRFAERTVRALAAPPGRGEDAPFGREMEEHMEAVRGEARRFLAKEGFGWEGLLAPPPPQEGTVAYCPRCHAQFTTAAGPCPDCGHPERLPHARRS